MKFVARAATMVRPRVVSLKGSCSAATVSLEIVDVATGKNRTAGHDRQPPRVREDA